MNEPATTDKLSQPVSVARMTAHYDGPALANHEIDVRQLGPALVGLSQMFERTQFHVDPTRRIRLNAKATSEGSVIIDLIVRVMTDDVIPALTGDPVTAGINALTIGGFVFGGFRILRSSLRHRGKPSKVEGSEGDDSKIDVRYPDGTVERTYAQSLEMIGDPDFVKGAKASTAPALEDGIERIEFHLPDESETIDTEDAEAIRDFSSTDENAVTSRSEMVVQALNPSFQEDGKWRITDGIKKQYVLMEDEAFKARIMDDEESLRANDTYKVVMRVEKSLDERNQLSVHYVAIEKVLDHRHVGEQGFLF